MHIKKYYIVLATLVLGFGIAIATPTVLATHISGTGCAGGCDGSVGVDAGPGGGYQDTNGNGQADTGEPGNAPNGGGGDRGVGVGGGVPPPPPPRPCKITLSAPVVANGTPSMRLTWTPAPMGTVNLRRFNPAPGVGTGTTLTVPYNAVTYTDDISKLTTGTYTYKLTYRRRVILWAGTGWTGQYACRASFKVVDTLTQCNDGLDNGDTEDALIDQNDPGCHTDGNPTNTATYNPLDTSELNPNADIVPTLTTVTKATARLPVQVTASAKNNSAYYAVSNSLVYGWRNTSSTARKPNCGIGGRSCFTENGRIFRRLNTFTRAYNSMQTQTDSVRAFRPLVNGQYEVCAIADFTNTVTEGVAGEANNRTCRIIVVDDNAVATTVSTIDGPLTITASPSVMRRGQTSTVKWDTGGRVQCSITNSTNVPTSFLDTDGDPRIVDEEATPALTTQTTYTITCTDPGFEATETATIRLLPEFREI